jgi:hypothetical protein
LWANGVRTVEIIIANKQDASFTKILILTTQSEIRMIFRINGYYILV